MFVDLFFEKKKKKGSKIYSNYGIFHSIIIIFKQNNRQSGF